MLRLVTTQELRPQVSLNRVDHRRWTPPTALLWASLLALIFVAYAVRVWKLGAQSLWLDEALSVVFARPGVRQVLSTLVNRDLHPPLYYLALHFWMQLAGDSEFSVRYVSVLLGLPVVPATYLLGRDLFRIRTPADAKTPAINPAILIGLTGAMLTNSLAVSGVLRAGSPDVQRPGNLLRALQLYPVEVPGNRRASLVVRLRTLHRGYPLHPVLRRAGDCLSGAVSGRPVPSKSPVSGWADRPRSRWPCLRAVATRGIPSTSTAPRRAGFLEGRVSVFVFDRARFRRVRFRAVHRAEQLSRRGVGSRGNRRNRAFLLALARPEDRRSGHLPAGVFGRPVRRALPRVDSRP